MGGCGAEGSVVAEIGMAVGMPWACAVWVVCCTGALPALPAWPFAAASADARSSRAASVAALVAAAMAAWPTLPSPLLYTTAKVLSRARAAFSCVLSMSGPTGGAGTEPSPLIWLRLRMLVGCPVAGGLVIVPPDCMRSHCATSSSCCASWMAWLTLVSVSTMPSYSPPSICSSYSSSPPRGACGSSSCRSSGRTRSSGWRCAG
mmetsp:Transcript_2166/g.5491  ORF Transcript_2166/g.5491 Transcript_2166/m.5491 type:complete len:204 (-) Transcript_2166:3242-3853(-)